MGRKRSGCTSLVSRVSSPVIPGGGIGTPEGGREGFGDRGREQADLKRQSFPAIQTVKALNSSADGESGLTNYGDSHDHGDLVKTLTLNLYMMINIHHLQ